MRSKIVSALIIASAIIALAGNSTTTPAAENIATTPCSTVSSDTALEGTIAIGSIYARYGEVFIGDNEWLNEYFSKYQWYKDAVDSNGDYVDFYDLSPDEQAQIIWILDNYPGSEDPSIF